jgi:hypothetical protein
MSIAPAGNTKDERMTSFVRCFASLFAEIQYVDDSAAIAPINIYDDDKANYTTDFNGHLIHEISECTWDAKEQVVTSPRSLSEMSAVYEFKSLDWVKNIVQTDHNLKKKHVDPTAAFNFEDPRQERQHSYKKGGD